MEPDDRMRPLYESAGVVSKMTDYDRKPLSDRELEAYRQQIEPEWGALAHRMERRMLATIDQLQADLKSATASYRAAAYPTPCNCHKQCGDVDDEIGTCKSLRRAPEPPLIEIVCVHRDDLIKTPGREK